MKYFITATDTDAGKTFVTEGLLNAFTEQGYRTLGFKPVASGCIQSSEGLRNEDALRLMAASSVKIPYEQVNPYAYEAAVAPYIAADLVGNSINLNQIVENIRENSTKADIVLVEGVGGWQVPLNQTQTVADLAKQLGFPVILVVNMRLGCLNNALLTVQSMQQTGVSLSGWIANIGPGDEPMSCLEENIDTMKQRIEAPLLAVLPGLNHPELNYAQVFSLMARHLVP